MSEFCWVRSELVCTTHKRTDTHSHSDTPDVDAEEVVEVKHVVSSNPHANVSDNNILGKRERGRESEGEREIANKEIWLGPLPIHIDSGSHVQGPFVASGVMQTHTHTHTHGLRQWKHYDISSASPTDKNQITAVNSKLRSVSLVGRCISSANMWTKTTTILISLHTA